ncbi:hypothetical protein [Paenibacillus cremeus]|uniref:hypothetical protein n=1 Tax=Paenibacillus cremeus TaxID=2163881 RepID=UPI0011A60278|nr:hypothetical protein [Paenibacillus cremeus]
MDKFGSICHILLVEKPVLNTGGEGTAKENPITYDNPLIWLKVTHPPRKVNTTEWRYQKEIKL